jgi:hypothetical protein
MAQGNQNPVEIFTIEKWLLYIAFLVITDNHLLVFGLIDFGLALGCWMINPLTY